MGHPTRLFTEIRSNFVEPDPRQLPSTTPPCKAPDGYHWLHAFSPDHRVDPLLVGKWLIWVTCSQVGYCWSQVQHATEEGSLSVSAKASTDWGNEHDPVGPWNRHVICVFTRDWHDQIDVLRVAKRLREIDAVRRQTLNYKPDVMTLEGLYSGNAPGETTVYSSKPPYERLNVSDENRLVAEELLGQLRQESL